MSLGDFLRRDAQTPLREHYAIGGVPCTISTNLQAILDAARETFSPLDAPRTEPRYRLRFWVDRKGTTQPPWPKPFFRGLGNLIFAGLDAQSSVLIDLRSRRVLGRFSPAMGADQTYWKQVILPVLVSIMGASMGITELHCGCVAQGGNGILLAGRSGSGKSTLALAMARAGFAYVSDDRTFCSERNGKLVTWGLPTSLKLRPPSAKMFQEFRGRNSLVTSNGERALLVDPDREPGFKRIQRCDPCWLVFLDRQEKSGFDFTPLPSAEAASRLEQDLIAETPEAAGLQRRTIENLVRLPCWKLRYGEPPQTVAREMARRLESLRHGTIHHQSNQGNALRNRLEFSPARQDPLRRFTPTPLVCRLPVMGRVIRLETNSRLILERVQSLFARYGRILQSQPDFLWRIVCEADSQQRTRWPEISAFSDSGLRFVNIGQRSFLAVDLEAREAVGYLARELVGNETGFVSPFLTTLFCLTAGALRLTPLAAACVKMDEKGLLVLGLPNNGKTTASYLAAKSGLEFYSDRAVFLDLDQGCLRAWADFAPAAFRMESSAFLPELQTLGRPFHYHDRTLLYVEESTAIRCNGRPVIPFSCVFLERGTAKKPRLTHLIQAESYRRLEECLPFKDDERFDARQFAALSALAQVPACSLRYGDDPAEAATFFPSLLSTHDLVEAKR